MSLSAPLLVRERPALVAIVLAQLSSLLYGGVVFGWASLQPMLVRAGAYAALCEDDDGSDLCPAQADRLGAVYSLSVAALTLASWPLGALLDAAQHALMVLAGALCTVSLALFAAFPRLGDGLLFVAGPLLGVGGMGFFFIGVASARLAPSRHAQTLLIVANCLFSSSPVVFLALDPVVIALGSDDVAAFTSVMAAYAGFTALFTLALALAWPRADDASELRVAIDANAGDDADSADALLGSKDDAARGAARHFWARDKPLREYAFAEQARTLEFVIIIAWSCLCMLRSFFYLGMIDDWCDAIGDASGLGVGTTRTAIVGIVVAGAVWVPFVAALFRRLGLAAGAHACNALSLASALATAAPSLAAQLVGAVFYAVFRGAFFGAITIFCDRVFGARTLGRTVGTVYTAGAIPALLSLPLLAWGESGAAGGWTAVNALQVLLALPMGGLVFALHHWSTEPVLALGTGANVNEV